MNLKRVITIIAFASCLLPLAAEAAAPDYDYLQLGYASFNDPSSSGISSDHSYGVAGSYNLNGSLVLGGGYSHEMASFQIPFSPVTEDLTGELYDVGLGYRIPLDDTWDFIPNLSYASAKTKAEALGLSASHTDTGYDASLAFRGMVTEQVELGASFDHSSVGSSANGVFVDGLYNFTHRFAVGLGYSSGKSDGETTTSWQIAFRYYFR